MLKKQSLKLFYKKYPYKIETRLIAGYLLRGTSVKQCLNQFDKWADHFWVKASYRKVSTLERVQFIDYCMALSPFDENEYRLRIEQSTVSIFIETKDLYDKIVKKLNTFITCVHEPASPDVLNFILNEQKKIVCKALPYEKYTHKISLKLMPENIRQNLHDWAENYSDDQIKISPTTKRYLKGMSRWCQSPYILVSDLKMAMMIGLAAHGYIRRTEEFVPLSSINTV